MSHLRHAGADFRVVIPARHPGEDRGGIQQNQKLRVADKTIVPLRGNYPINWIPACAEMAEEGYA